MAEAKEQIKENDRDQESNESDISTSTGTLNIKLCRMMPYKEKL